MEFPKDILFGYAVALYGDRDLVGTYHSDEKDGGSGVAYIFCSMNRCVS